MRTNRHFCKNKLSPVGLEFAVRFVMEEIEKEVAYFKGIFYCCECGVYYHELKYKGKKEEGIIVIQGEDPERVRRKIKSQIESLIKKGYEGEWMFFPPARKGASYLDYV